MPATLPSTKPTVLIIRDGWGHNPFPEWNKANAIHLANTPVNDRLVLAYPNIQIATSGEDVGLPLGVMGNSEVGHQNIGAGRIVDQEVMRITRRIRDESFFSNPTLLGAFAHAQKTGGSVHLLGLFSDGRVHSDPEHAYAIIDLAKRLAFPGERLFVHAITDGRDTAPSSGLEFIRDLERKLAAAGIGRISSIIGRYWAMDRDNRWDRVALAYNMLVNGTGVLAESAETAVADYYETPKEPTMRGDEFIMPTLIAPGGSLSEKQLIRDGDAVIFFNYRGDRPRELCKAFVCPEVELLAQPNGGMPRTRQLENLYFAGMTGYEQGLPIQVVFDRPAKMENIMGGYVSALGLAQFRCAETEKFPHVTFFFNDYREPPFEREDRLIVPSPRDVSTYDQKPEMSAPGVCAEVVRRVESGLYDFIVVNFANGDMVGHTGSLPAAIQAVEVVDACVGQIVTAVQARGGSLIVTADHGNAEQMIDPATGGPHTAHTTYPVDLILVDDRFKGKTLRSGGRLADISPTALTLMGLPQPAGMSGVSLLS